MKFIETELQGAFVIELEKITDSRGYFSRCFCIEEFKKHGLNPDIKQCNTSYNINKGTLRGLHFQGKPKSEAKLVRCIRGSVYDVIVDLRQGSTTFLQWFAVELNESNSRMLYVPEGFAHGFQTLEDNVEMQYQMSEFYTSELASGIRWNDPNIKIKWPLPDPFLSEKDNSYPDFIKL